MQPGSLPSPTRIIGHEPRCCDFIDMTDHYLYFLQTSSNRMVTMIALSQPTSWTDTSVAMASSWLFSFLDISSHLFIFLSFASNVPKYWLTSSRESLYKANLFAFNFYEVITLKMVALYSDTLFVTWKSILTKYLKQLPLELNITTLSPTSLKLLALSTYIFHSSSHTQHNKFHLETQFR